MKQGTTIDLASVDAVLGTARSVRRNLDFTRPVDPDLLFECIDLATQAPTGLGGEQWRFVVVTDADRKRELAALYAAVLDELERARGIAIKATQRALVDRLPDIPAMIFVCSATPGPGAEWPAQIAFYGSILPAAWSLMLALRARNLGATWTTLLSARQHQVATILGMPDGAMLTVMLPVAHTKGVVYRRAARLGARSVTFWNRWGESLP
jgi:nitroreductase